MLRYFAEASRGSTRNSYADCILIRLSSFLCKWLATGTALTEQEDNSGFSAPWLFLDLMRAVPLSKLYVLRVPNNPITLHLKTLSCLSRKNANSSDW